MTEVAPVRTVAVLGTGHMGSAMSRALAHAGFDLVLYNRTLSRCEPLAAELGCRVHETLNDLPGRHVEMRHVII